MKILYVSRFLPYPEVRDSGGQDRYHYLEALSQSHDLVLTGFHPPQAQKAVDQMRELCQEVVVIPYDEQALGGRLWRAAWRILFPRVYGRVVSPRYRHALKQLRRRHRFDIAIVEGEMAQYGTLLTHIPRVLDEVDIYSAIAYQSYRRESRRLPRLLLYLDWLRTHAFELRYVERYEGVFVRSAKDADFLRNYAPHLPIHVLDPWFEGLGALQAIPAHRPVGNVLLFVGAMQNPKNIEAVHFFVGQVLPLVRARIPDAVLYVTGGAPPASIVALDSREDVVVTGEVADLRPHYEKCAVNVVPLLVGGGIIVKTLNGMAAARPTVSTPAGAAGMTARPEIDLVVVSPEPAAFASATVELLQNRDRWQLVAENGRAFVQEHYDWSTITSGMDRYLRNLAQTKS